MPAPPGDTSLVLYTLGMAAIPERLSIDWLKKATDAGAQRGAAAALSLEQGLAAAIKDALSSRPDRQSDVATLAKLLGVKFSAVLPVVEKLADQGDLKLVREDQAGGNHLVQL